MGEIAERGRAIHRGWVRAHLRPAARAPARRGARAQDAQLVAVTDVYMWKLLRRDAGLSRPQAERALQELIDGLEGAVMAKVLVYTSPARGHLYPIIPTLDELRRRGHEVAVRTLASQVAAMRARGFDAAPIAPAIEAIEHDDFRARTPQGAIKRALVVFARRAEHEVPDLQAAIDAERPDLLLVDAQTWGGARRRRALGRRMGELAAVPHAAALPEVPPFGPGLPPARGPAGRLRDRVLRPLLRRVLRARDAAAAQRGARPGSGSTRCRHRTSSSPGRPLLLYLTAEPFEYPRTTGPRTSG